MPEYRVPYNSFAFSNYLAVNLDHTESLRAFINSKARRESLAYGFAYTLRRGLDPKPYAESYRYAAQFGFNLYLEYWDYLEFHMFQPFAFGSAVDKAPDSRVYRFADSLGLDSAWYSATSAVISLTCPAVSESNPDLWAYYQTAEKRALHGSDGQGIRTQIKYGKLLKKLFPMATDSQIAEEVEAWKEAAAAESAPLEYFIATDRESFKRVYTGEQAPTLNPTLRSGFKSMQGSCMRHDSHYFGLPNGLHPCEVYASGDFAIVWAEKAGKIAARAVVPVNPSYDYDKTLPQLLGLSAPIYTTSDSASHGLKAFIEANGATFEPDSYTVNRAWNKAGYNLLKIEVESGAYLMPYVDTNSAATDNGDYFKIDESGDVDIRQTGGKVYWEESPRYSCECCGESLSEDETHSTDDSGIYCESCFDDRYFYCPRLGEYVDSDETVELYSLVRYGNVYHETVAQSWAESNAIMCQDDGEYWESDYATYIDGKYYSPQYHDYFVSDWDGETYHDVDGVTLSNGETVSLAEVQANPDWVCIEGQWYPVDETLIAPMIAAE